jgi:prepilin-type N-terminal cleavage/methylation domain-containing protein
MTWRKKLARGFTLIEMSIVLVVIGLVLSGGLLAVAPVLQSSKTSETNQRLDRIEQALLVYAIRNGCLPCPADRALATTAANSTTVGRAHAGATYYANGCRGTACSNTEGAVPWITLGLSEAEITDGFGARIEYALSPNLQNVSGLVRTPPSSYPAGSITVQTRLAGAVTAEAAYVLVSHGLDRSNSILAVSATAVADIYASPNQLNNRNIASGITPAVQDEIFAPTGAGTAYFDDLVRFRTAPLMIQLCGSNACGNPA